VPEPPPAPPIEQRGLESRMQNWVRWCTTWGCYPRGGDEDSAARACRIAYEAKFGPAPSAGTSNERREIDEEDAMRIERSLWQLPNLQRDLLRLHYVRNRKWYEICHIVGMRARRPLFNEKLIAALATVACILDCEQ
jgi:DNA-directed RNA polymerase specialized sigma24 family protein